MAGRRRNAKCDSSGPVQAGDVVQVPAACFEGSGKRGTLSATVLEKYHRWALVQTEAGYKTSVWLDQRGRMVT